MLVEFSKNPLYRTIGILYYNRNRLLFFFIAASIAVWLHKMHIWFGWMDVNLPVIPVTILGGALAIFLGFRNNSAYDRWWEARKIWGGVVNYSRTFSVLILSFSSPYFSKGSVSEEEIKHWQKNMIYRHICWLYALGMHLRKKYDWEKLNDYVPEDTIEKLKGCANGPTQLIHMQAQQLKSAYENHYIEDFRHMELSNILKEFYNLQGKAERIKNTIFPYYYNYFTRVFLRLFIVCLPFTLINYMGWGTIPMTMAIAFVFSMLEKSGEVTEDPFEGRAADTPISTIIRGIEIDLREMMEEDDIPHPMPIKKGRFGVTYLD